MTDTIQLGEILIRVTKKEVKNVHLSVHPPEGRVTLTVPTTTRLDVARAYAISLCLGWIRQQQEQLKSQAREAPRKFVERESHSIWGRRYLMTIKHADAKPSVILDHKRITFTVRPAPTPTNRAKVLHEWHKSLLHQVVPSIIRKWQPKLKVHVASYFLQRMKTKWGKLQSPGQPYPPQHRTGKEAEGSARIRHCSRNGPSLGAYSQRALHGDSLGKHYPTWKKARAELNALPLGAEYWSEMDR